MAEILIGRKQKTNSGGERILITDTAHTVVVAVERRRHRLLGHYLYAVYTDAEHDPDDIPGLILVLQRAQEITVAWAAESESEADHDR